VSSARTRSWRDLRSALFIDRGPPDATTLVCGMGRSGTTWVAQLIDHDRSHRLMFEPFFPARVPEARPFAYIQYMNPRDDDPQRRAAANRILSGRLRNPAVDRSPRGWLFRRRLIKEIRCSLMLGWLARLRPALPIVLVVRHPLAVTASWLRLGWGTESQGARTDYEVMTSQTRLLQDFPALRDLASHIDPAAPLDRIVFQWCAFHLVPLRQLPDGRPHIVHYENLLLHREAEFERLASFLGIAIRRGALAAAFDQPSATSWHDDRTADFPIEEFTSRYDSGRDERDASHVAGRDAGRVASERLLHWQHALSTAQVDRALHLLSLCGLDAWYGRDGRPAGISLPARGPS